jgi:hypothetical protein
MALSPVSIVLILAAAGLVVFLPGAAWLVWMKGRYDPFERLAEAAGISLALTALFALVTFYLNIHLPPVGFVALYGLALLAWLAPQLLQGFQFRLTAGTLLAVAALLALVAWRIFQARRLAFPAWVDPVHHTLLVRIILETGGIPSTWQPYLPAPFYYHFGFHAFAASFAAFSQLELSQAVLLFGQLVNALVALSVYRLGKALWGDWKRAGLAALLVGFCFQMPAYYVSWGRYTLLAGLVVLPLAMAAALEAQREPESRSILAKLALYTAAIFLCHYMAAILFGIFLGLLAARQGIEWFLAYLRLKRQAGSTILPKIPWQAWAAVLAGVGLVLPWLVRVWQFSSPTASISITNLADPAALSTLRGDWDYFTYLAGPEMNYALLALGAAGLLVELVLGKGRIFSFWSLALIFFSLPVAPKVAPFRFDHFVIVLFLPAALFAVSLIHKIARLARRMPSRWAEHAYHLVFACFSLVLLVFGLLKTGDVINPVTVFTTPADGEAAAWIAKNTPPSARFFINGTLWQGVTHRGVDGGYWIMPSTGRFTVIPPAAIGWALPQDLIAHKALSERVEQVKSCDERFWQIVREQALTHVYLRTGTGSLQPEGLSGCSGVTEVYAAGGVIIYRLTLP